MVDPTPTELMGPAVAGTGLQQAAMAGTGYWGTPTATIDFCEPN